MAVGTVDARPVTGVVAGVTVTGCAVVAGLVAAVPGWLFGVGGRLQLEWNYLGVFWVLALGVAVAGVVVAARPGRGRVAAVVAAVLAAQVCGHGVVAVRDWFNRAGVSGGMRQSELAMVVGFAAVVAVCAAVATCVSVSLVWREPVGGWRGLRPRRPGFLPAGLIVAVVVPVVLSWVLRSAPLMMTPSTVMTTIGQYGVTYSLPWGAAVAAGAWLGRRESRAAMAAAGLCAALVAAEFAVRVMVAP